MIIISDEKQQTNIEKFTFGTVYKDSSLFSYENICLSSLKYFSF